MNRNINIGAEIIKQLESAGFRAAFLPYHCIEHIIKTYDELSEKSGSIKYAQNAINHFRNHQPPDIPFEPLSFLIAAYSGDRAQIVFQAEGKRVAVTLPPTYLDDKEKQRLDDTLELLLKGCQTAHTRGISQKLLTVLSGLGRYGRNNICYIEGFGSYFNLRAFYTDIPCEDFYCSLRFLDKCETCNLCRKNCPTGAIGESSVIDAARCLTLYNEQNNPMPDWLPQDTHHTLIGCLRCQEICPMNKPLPEIAVHTLELDEIETQTLLSSDSEKLPQELKQKFIEFGLDEHFISIVGRNANLALKNITAG